MRPFAPQPVDFDGTTNSRIVCSLGAVDVATGFTMVALWRPVAATAYRSMLSVEQATGGALVSILLTNGNSLYWENNGLGNFTTAATVTADVWHLLAVTKASGTSAPRSHVYSSATAAWTRQNHTAVGDTLLAAQSQVSMGVFDAGTAHPADGYAAAWAIYGDPLSDAQLDQFPVHYSKWVDGLGPQAFWVADGTTPLNDLVGTADETSRGSGVTAAPVSVVAPVTWAHEFRPDNSRWPRAVPPRLRSPVAA